MKKRVRRHMRRERSTAPGSVLVRKYVPDPEELDRYRDRLNAFHQQRFQEFLPMELKKLELKAEAILESSATEPLEEGGKRALRSRVRAAIALVRKAQERQAQQDLLMDSEPDDFEDGKPDWKTSLQFAKMLLKMQGVKPDRLQYLSKREFEKEQKELVMNLLNK